MDADSLDDAGLDAFFDAAESQDKNRVHLAAEKMRRGIPATPPESVAATTPRQTAQGAVQDIPARRAALTPADVEIKDIVASLVELVDDLNVPDDALLTTPVRHSEADADSNQDNVPTIDHSQAPPALADFPTSLVEAEGDSVGSGQAHDHDTDDDDEVPPWLSAPAEPAAKPRVHAPTTAGLPKEPKKDPETLEDSESTRLLLADLEGKFIAVDAPAGSKQTSDPFVLVPAHVHTYMPWWGWLTIGLGLAMLVAGVILLPLISLNRTAARLGDPNEATARQAMRQLILRGDERTVKKLFSIALESGEPVPTRLRAIDTMTLIERVPEVDRALLRLELSDTTHEQVREAAIAARRQRAASRARRRR